VLSVRGLCDELITRPEESYRLWCVVVCDLETSRMRRPALGRSATAKKKKSKYVDLGGCAVSGIGQQPLACWNCGFESRRGHGSLSVVSVVFCQVEVCQSYRSLVQSSI